MGEGSYSSLPPELRRLIGDITWRSKNIDAIIVRERSRLTRNILYELMIDELLVKKSVRLISVRECNIPIPSFIFESLIKWKD